MTWKIGLVDNASMLAHYAMLETIRDFATTELPIGQRWQVLRYETAPANRELILKGPGISGTEEIFVGFRTYQSVSADYYNLVAGVFTGYVAGNSFDAQPGARLSGIPAHNRAIEYFMVGNGQRIALCMKVGTPVYMHGYVGKYFPYAAPGEYRSPLLCAGMLDGATETRFSDPEISMPYKGARANFAMRSNMGSWLEVESWPWNNAFLCGEGSSISQVRPTSAMYYPQRVQLTDAANLYGTLDGIYYITGFDNAVENVAQMGGSYMVDQAGKTVAQIVTEIIDDAGGRAFMVLQDAARTGFNDYIAMEMA